MHIREGFFFFCQNQNYWDLAIWGLGGKGSSLGFAIVWFRGVDT